MSGTASGVITGIEQVTPNWLTAVLKKSGVLTQGEVGGVETAQTATLTATAIPLTLRYSDDAPAAVPEKLFLKLGRRKPEVDFYNVVLPLMTGVPVVQCYDAAFANHLGVSHLLMDDVSATHVEPPDALPLSEAVSRQLIDILACLHAQWWEHPRLADDLRAVLDDVPTFILKQVQDGFAHFRDTLGDRLSPKRRGWYERILAAWPLPSWQARLRSHQAVTLVHGDSHWWNFLLPRDEGPIYLIDWAVWHLNVGPSDLAYLFGQSCYGEWRARFERPLVEYYHERLLAYGVTGYSWEQCWLDYRTTMVFHALWPIFHHAWAPNILWWRNLECCMSAFEALHCEELLS
jgi:hypothetical protein